MPDLLHSSGDEAHGNRAQAQHDSAHSGSQSCGGQVEAAGPRGWPLPPWPPPPFVSTGISSRLAPCNINQNKEIGVLWDRDDSGAGQLDSSQNNTRKFTWECQDESSGLSSRSTPTGHLSHPAGESAPQDSESSPGSTPLWYDTRTEQGQVRDVTTRSQRDDQSQISARQAQERLQTALLDQTPAGAQSAAQNKGQRTFSAWNADIAPVHGKGPGSNEPQRVWSSRNINQHRFSPWTARAGARAKMQHQYDARLPSLVAEFHASVDTSSVGNSASCRSSSNFCSPANDQGLHGLLNQPTLNAIPGKSAACSNSHEAPTDSHAEFPMEEYRVEGACAVPAIAGSAIPSRADSCADSPAFPIDHVYQNLDNPRPANAAESAVCAAALALAGQPLQRQEVPSMPRLHPSDVPPMPASSLTLAQRNAASENLLSAGHRDHVELRLRSSSEPGPPFPPATAVRAVGFPAVTHYKEQSESSPGPGSSGRVLGSAQSTARCHRQSAARASSTQGYSFTESNHPVDDPFAGKSRQEGSGGGGVTARLAPVGPGRAAEGQPNLRLSKMFPSQAGASQPGSDATKASAVDAAAAAAGARDTRAPASAAPAASSLNAVATIGGRGYHAAGRSSSGGPLDATLPPPTPIAAAAAAAESEQDPPSVPNGAQQDAAPAVPTGAPQRPPPMPLAATTTTPRAAGTGSARAALAIPTEVVVAADQGGHGGEGGEGGGEGCGQDTHCDVGGGGIGGGGAGSGSGGSGGEFLLCQPTTAALSALACPMCPSARAVTAGPGKLPDVDGGGGGGAKKTTGPVVDAAADQAEAACDEPENVGPRANETAARAGLDVAPGGAGPGPAGAAPSAGPAVSADATAAKAGPGSADVAAAACVGGALKRGLKAGLAAVVAAAAAAAAVAGGGRLGGVQQGGPAWLGEVHWT